MKEKTRIYPLFLPHAGCRFQCVYCNQWVVKDHGPGISSGSSLISYFQAQLAKLEEQAQTSRRPGEIAFYGGTFTSLPREVLRELLEAVSYRISQGTFSGVRFSTRPDSLTPEICAFLAGYPIQTVELGVQSLSDEVLAQSRRAYTGEAVCEAVAFVRNHHWRLGIQLMAGLPGETRESFLSSVSKAICLRPDFVRIYPTLVLPGTVLADWYARGLFRPLTLDDAVLWCTAAYERFSQANIPVIRMGLHADPELQKPGNIIAGPYHPAFGCMVRARWWRERIDKHLDRLLCARSMNKLIIRVPQASLSEVVGHKRENVLYWQAKWGSGRVRIIGAAESMPGSFECVVEEVIEL